MEVNRFAEKYRGEHSGMREPPQFEKFGQRLQYWRELRGYKKQGALAEAIGITQPSLSELETGKSNQPAAHVLLKLAEVLQLRPRYLLLGEGAPEVQYFQELSGLEAQLVMIFRQLPTDALRDSMLIDANDMLNRSSSKGHRPLQTEDAHVVKKMAAPRLVTEKNTNAAGQYGAAQSPLNRVLIIGNGVKKNDRRPTEKAPKPRTRRKP